MRVIAVYSLKGGVGKTTTAVNLAYLAAASGTRTLLWDLDPQGASSFAFRIRPRVDGFGKRSLDDGETLAAAIKETDYDNLDVLPADFAYRKLDRLLDRTGHPERIWPALVNTIGRQYDAVFFDCPPGVSRLTEGVFAAASLVLVPTIPTVLSLRTLAWLLEWSDRQGAVPALAAMLSMVDRRKALHRRTCQWAGGHPDLFLSAQIPYASIVEQMAMRRMPLPAFAPSDAATTAARAAWEEIEPRAERKTNGRPGEADRKLLRREIEALIRALEADAAPGAAPNHAACDRDLDDVANRAPGGAKATPMNKRDAAAAGEGVMFAHRFDTDHGDLQGCGCVLELRECSGRYFVGISRTPAGSGVAATATELQVDARWAVQILAGTLSALAALERRLGRAHPPLLVLAREAVGDRSLRRIESRHMTTDRTPEAHRQSSIAS